MRRFLSFTSALLLTSVQFACYAADGELGEPRLLAETDTVRFYNYGSDDHRRYGRFLSFTLKEETTLDDGTVLAQFGRHLAACDGSWSSQRFSTSYTSSHARTIRTPDERGHAYQTSFETGLEGIPVEARAGVSRNLASWCAKGRSKRSDEVSLFSGSKHSEYVILRSIKNRGPAVEAWSVMVPIKRETVTGSDGSPVMGLEGQPLTKTVADTERGDRKHLTTYNCERQTYIQLKSIYYNVDGTVEKSLDFSDNQKPESIVPDTLGEVVIDALCLMSKSL